MKHIFCIGQRVHFRIERENAEDEITGTIRYFQTTHVLITNRRYHQVYRLVEFAIIKTGYGTDSVLWAVPLEDIKQLS